MAQILPVDRLEVLVLVDNVTDSLSTNSKSALSEWMRLVTAGRLRLLAGHNTCCAHHGLSLLIAAHIGNVKHTVLF
jgi:7,8-dihydropterin-6-yl-methyl-4-(beta-D-ribofuranosyl)aminobenzene 5'-phosphate synthase